MAQHQPGDRVIVRDGRHGMVEGLDATNNLYTVFLDTLITIHTDAIQPETKQFVDPKDRVPVFDGVVDPRPLQPDRDSIGTALRNLFYYVRFLADPQQRPLPVIAQFNATEAMKLNETAIQHWNNIHAKLVRLVRTRSTAEQKFLLPALFDRRCAPSWHDKAIVADFWLMGKDYEGMYVIPDDNRNVVYKIVGIAKQQHAASTAGTPSTPPALTLNQQPICQRLLVVPFYGRLLYDSTTIVSSARQPSMRLAQALRMVTRISLQKNRVVEHLAELEFPPS